MKIFSMFHYLVPVCFTHHRITFCRCFFNKKKNQATPYYCSFFKLIASSSANIFWYNKWFQTMKVIHYTISLHHLLFCTTVCCSSPLFYTLTPTFSHVDMLFGKQRCQNCRRRTLFCSGKFFGFCVDGSYGRTIIRLTCSLGHFFEILFSSRLWHWTISIFFFEGGGGSGHSYFCETGVKTDSEVYCSMLDMATEPLNDTLFESCN